jgi:amino acid transporter
MGAVGLFLIAHGLASLKPYGLLDCMVNIAAGVFAILIASFPCLTVLVDIAGVYPIPIKTSATIHNISAALFFGLRAFNILVLFTKSDGNPTPEKLKRNKVYKVCGFVIVGFMAFQAVTSGLALHGPYTMANEIVMLTFDGISWLIKSEAMLKDKPVTA